MEMLLTIVYHHVQIAPTTVTELVRKRRQLGNNASAAIVGNCLKHI